MNWSRWLWSQARQFLRVQVKPQQEQQENDANLTDISHIDRWRNQVQHARPGNHAREHVRDQQRLAAL